MNEQKLLWTLMGALILSTLADMYTALSSPIFKIAEINPIYILTGSVIPLIALNFIVLYWFWTKLSKSLSLYAIYFFTLLTVVLVVLHGFGVYSNLTALEQYESNPEVYVEAIGQLSQEAKITTYFLYVGTLFLLLLGIPMIVFYSTMHFYHQRKPERDKIVDEIYEQAMKLGK